MDELNKKLAEWAGLKNPKLEEEGIMFTDVINGQKWTNLYVDLFTKSLDACFKWLVPELEEDGWDWHITSNRIVLQKDERYYEVHYSDHNTALAFCLAMDKLIGGK